MFAHVLSCCVWLIAAAPIPAATAHSPDAVDMTQIQEGHVVTASAGSLTIAAENNQQHTYEVADSVPVMIHGKPAKLADLQLGMLVAVTLDKDGKVMAVSTVDRRKLEEP